MEDLSVRVVGKGFSFKLPCVVTASKLCPKIKLEILYQDFDLEEAVVFSQSTEGT